MMKVNLKVAISFLVYFFSVNVSYGEELENTQKLLTIVGDYAERICKDISLSGSSENINVSGNIDAGLPGLLKKVIDLDIGAGAKYSNTDYIGLLRSDLVNALYQNSNCKIAITTTLLEKLTLTSAEKTLSSTENQWKVPRPITGLKQKYMGGNEDRYMTWNDNSNNESGFNIYRCVQNVAAFYAAKKEGSNYNCSWKYIRSVPENATEFVDKEDVISSDGSGKNNYYYRVAPYNEHGESELSEAIPVGMHHILYVD